MKKTIIIVLLLLIGIGVMFGTSVNQRHEEVNVKEKFLRIHIRANSNDEVDQKVKYIIKDDIVNYLSPIVVDCISISQATDRITQNIENIEEITNQSLSKNGFNYKASVNLRTEYFPDRYYDDFFLENGIYNALIVELGSGNGNNWWCVVYPPLCFINGKENSTGEIKYKSKLMEIIDKFR